MGDIRSLKIPDEVSFRTKPQIAQAMLEQAWAEGLPMKWVVGDSLSGNSPQLRNAIHRQDRYYVLGLGSHHPIQIAASEQSLPLKTLPQHFASKDWEQLCFRIGEKGLICYDWQARRIQMPNDEVGEQWLLIQRSLSDSPQYRFYLSNAPDDASLLDLVAVALSRRPIEELFEEAKSEVGMTDYEVRHWHSWHRHMSLVMLAHTYLKLIQYQQREKKSIAPFLELQPA
ncbi:MAG: transposase [Anaerolineae bacterium]|nr:transposase [Anaerolineae bacterium]MDQ7035571.1 transposase [Anaerolineae bacterium]